jgi:hypothetical protein
MLLPWLDRYCLNFSGTCFRRLRTCHRKGCVQDVTRSRHITGAVCAYRPVARNTAMQPPGEHETAHEQASRPGPDAALLPFYLEHLHGRNSARSREQQWDAAGLELNKVRPSLPPDQAPS